ncbi:hypothetical protein OG874_21890 [Nocardia sp. NBC_00565]|uniref:hypothetical protein n=1 Tax=Nocardia sp. NBC_00565 TaxID=2975993 RepID=UPI002E822A81|nr:hypothetical protein [Nocardia sp. NBC_00565]WUC07570.1 hypothetical protein OG874_21890 [Nocardia sp. NBC_00565]
MTANAPPDTPVESADLDSSGPRPSTFTVPLTLIRRLQWFLEGFCIYGLALHGYSLEQVLAADHSNGSRRSFDHGPGGTP